MNKCNQCREAIEEPFLNSNQVHSISPEKADGKRDTLIFCNEECYDKYHEENYIKIPYKDNPNNFYYGFKK